eukprot:CAMPEP_0175828930 /NCGR_PEP_ID=MMETSP0107_2-20121207/13068_1 /TAXON_ID=195067 ORGANISM="Goniomonas pacifica, Strain CCMP1869" /NCGR_SAMPLE_ID=MMETSP0107_2 /ASSEMBLY_ACC=CAM_ASM_000203 /LENGTH=137 /DNA_ID=CAMNT_0017141683 /DNA_START=66 /DNA_END=475 /DNA_ORIENTATION=+
MGEIISQSLWANADVLLDKFVSIELSRCGALFRVLLEGESDEVGEFVREEAWGRVDWLGNNLLCKSKEVLEIISPWIVSKLALKGDNSQRPDVAVVGVRVAVHPFWRHVLCCPNERGLVALGRVAALDCGDAKVAKL